MSPEWLTGAPPAPVTKRQLGRAFGMSIAAHAGFALLLLVFMSVHETPVDTKTPPIRLNVFYLPTSGVAHGGGGHPSPASAKATEVPHHELPKPVTITPVTITPEPPRDVPVIDVPIETSAANLLRFAGVNPAALQPGGGGPGSGAGPGPGRGVDDGRDGNRGGGRRQPGGDGDITMPVVIRSVDPKYTSAALTAKLSGAVELEVVVLGNGTVGSIKVVKSLDKTYGLDQEAINAARQWMFQPSTQNGRPVDVIVRIILEFRIH